MAASVGLATLTFLEKIERIPPEMEEGKKDFDAEARMAQFFELGSLVLGRIIPA